MKTWLLRIVVVLLVLPPILVVLGIAWGAVDGAKRTRNMREFCSFKTGDRIETIVPKARELGLIGQQPGNFLGVSVSSLGHPFSPQDDELHGIENGQIYLSVLTFATASVSCRIEFSNRLVTSARLGGLR